MCKIFEQSIVDLNNGQWEKHCFESNKIKIENTVMENRKILGLAIS